MKQTGLKKILAAVAIYAAAVGLAIAQQTTTTTTTDPVTGTTTTQQTTTSSVGNIVTYTPDSDYFIPNSGKCGTRPLLLHEGHDCFRPRRSGCKLVDHSSGPAGDHLLYNYGRPGRGAESCAEPASHGYQARGNDYDHDDKTVTQESFPPKIKSARARFRGRFSFSSAPLELKFPPV